MTRSILRATLIALSFTAITSLAVARSADMRETGQVQLVTSTSATTVLSPEAVRRAIITGGSVHSWRAVGDKPGVVTLEATSGQHRVVVDVSYDAKSFEIKYKSSDNMNYELDGTRVHIHPKYNKWVNDLSIAISAAAAAPRPDAQQ